MDKQALEEKKAAIQQQFEVLQSNNDNVSKQITTNNEELLKLAGEFRLVEDLLNNWVDPVKGKKNG